ITGLRGLVGLYLGYSPVIRLLNRSIDTRRSSGQAASGVTVRSSGGALRALIPISGEHYYRNAIEKYEAGWSEVARCVQEAKRLCTSRHAKLMVLFVPSRLRVLLPYLDFRSSQYREKLISDPGSEQNSEFGDQLRKVCSNSGVDCIDLFADFK